MSDQGELHSLPGDEKIVHDFHLGYRNAGIALCISLAAVAGAECWWLYGGVLNGGWSDSVDGPRWLWWSCLLSGVVVLGLSFAVQSVHYLGMKSLARWAYARYAFVKNLPEVDGQSHKKTAEDSFTVAQGHFRKADRWVLVLISVAGINAVAVFTFLVWRLFWRRCC